MQTPNCRNLLAQPSVAVIKAIESKPKCFVLDIHISYVTASAPNDNQLEMVGTRYWSQSWQPLGGVRVAEQHHCGLGTFCTKNALRGCDAAWVARDGVDPRNPITNRVRNRRTHSWCYFQNVW